MDGPGCRITTFWLVVKGLEEVKGLALRDYMCRELEKLALLFTHNNHFIILILFLVIIA